MAKENAKGDSCSSSSRKSKGADVAGAERVRETKVRNEAKAVTEASS